MFFHNYILEVIFSVNLLLPLAQGEFDPILDEGYPYVNDYHRNVVHYNCGKIKSCISNNVKICGYDDLDNELADFDELCTMYKVNCHYKRGFRQVDMEVCKARNLADVQYPSKNTIVENTNIEGNKTESGARTETLIPSFGFFDWEEENTLQYQKRQIERNISDNMQEDQNREGQKQDDQNIESKKQGHHIIEGKIQDDQIEDKTLRLRMALINIARRFR